MARDNMTYEEAAHAMQSGVAFDHEFGSQDGTPKYLRVGINSAMTDHCALVELLMKKGIVTKEEYLEAIRVAMIEEVRRYEERLSEMTSKKIILE